MLIIFRTSSILYQKRNVARGPEHIERVIARLKFTYSFAFEKWWFCLHSGDQDRQSSAQIFLHAGSSEYLHRFLCLGEHLPRVVFAFRLAAHYMSRYLLDLIFIKRLECRPD